jgi:hypothetical protein
MTAEWRSSLTAMSSLTGARVPSVLLPAAQTVPSDDLPEFAPARRQRIPIGYSSLERASTAILLSLVKSHLLIAARLHRRYSSCDLLCVRPQLDPTRVRQHQNSNSAAREVLLIGELFVGCHQDVEFSVCLFEQIAIGTFRPTGFESRYDFMPDEKAAQWHRRSLIEEDAHPGIKRTRDSLRRTPGQPELARGPRRETIPGIGRASRHLPGSRTAPLPVPAFRETPRPRLLAMASVRPLSTKSNRA